MKNLLKNPFATVKELGTWLRLSPSFIRGVYRQHTQEKRYKTLDQFIRELAPEPEDQVNLVGHSYGGILAMRYALTNTSKIDQIVTVASAFRGTDGVIWGHAMHPLGIYTPILDDLKKDSDFSRMNEFYIMTCLHILTENAEVFNIVTPNDEFVPYDSMTLTTILPPDDYQEIEVKEGHCRAFFSPTTTNIVRKVIAGPCPSVFIPPILETSGFYTPFLVTLPEHLKERVKLYDYDYMKRYTEVLETH